MYDDTCRECGIEEDGSEIVVHDWQLPDESDPIKRCQDCYSDRLASQTSLSEMEATVLALAGYGFGNNDIYNVIYQNQSVDVDVREKRREIYDKVGVPTDDFDRVLSEIS